MGFKMKISIKKQILLLLFLLVFDIVFSEKILSVAFFSRKSHKLTYLPLLEELGKRGHNVTILTPNKPTKVMKNVNEILTLNWEELEKKFAQDNEVDPFKSKRTGNKFPFLNLRLYQDLCIKNYDLPIIQQILQEKFDLILLQPMFNDCVLGLLYRLKAPIVLFTPMSIPSFWASKAGAHFPTSFFPNYYLDYGDEMNYYQRFINFGYYLTLEAVLRFYYEPAMEAIYREKLGQDIPSVSEIISEQVALVLSNGHFTLHGPKPYYPNIVDVGGIHSKPAKPLPQDLEEFIQKGGKKGFIYFSMGTAILGSQMPEQKRKMFLNVFAKLEQQVLWKWETESMPDLPQNVKLSKWLPQQDLLGHKDAKMFITHCGGGSIEEAIYHGTPLIGFPMFADQPKNAKLADSHGVIVTLDWNTVTEETFMAAIQEILNNSSYTENVKRLSTLYRDQPDKPLERAVYWVEYVLRHKGAHHLRSVGRKLNWFQYHSYDVIVTYFALILTTVYTVYKILSFIVRLCCGKVKSEKVTNKKRKKE